MELTLAPSKLIINETRKRVKMNFKIKPFISNFYIPIAIEVSHIQEYDEKKQTSFRTFEDLKNSTNTSSVPTNDADADAADSLAEL